LGSVYPSLFSCLAFSARHYAALNAFFLGVTYIMGAWIAMVFILGHYKPGLWKFGSGGIVVSIALFMLGAL